MKGCYDSQNDSEDDNVNVQHGGGQAEEGGRREETEGVGEGEGSSSQKFILFKIAFWINLV